MCVRHIVRNVYTGHFYIFPKSEDHSCLQRQILISLSFVLISFDIALIYFRFLHRINKMKLYHTMKPNWFWLSHSICTFQYNILIHRKSFFKYEKWSKIFVSERQIRRTILSIYLCLSLSERYLVNPFSLKNLHGNSHLSFSLFPSTLWQM